VTGSEDPEATSDPELAYCRGRDARAQAAAALEGRARRLSDARLALFVAAAFAAYLAFGRALFAPGFLALPGLGFVLLVLWHDRVLRSAGDARRAVAFYENGLARLDGGWVEFPGAGAPEGAATHPYAEDLDCVGRGSLFQRVSTARTRAGDEVLLAWLLQGADPQTLRERQRAVAELRPRLELREALATLGDEARDAVESTVLASWAREAVDPVSRGVRLTALLLPALCVALGAGWLQGSVPPLPLLIALSVQAGFAARLRSRVGQVLQAVEAPARDLVLLLGLLSRLEAEPFAAPRLLELQQRLLGQGEPASRRIARLRRLVDLLDARRNQLFAPIAALLLWSTNLAFGVDVWRVRHAAELQRWIDALGEIEALVSLASYAFERPHDVFPELLESGPLCFEAESLGHPLLADDRCVRNDVELSESLRLIVVSGSNMSGKSTLLRAIGINVVLAQAGAPVCARRLRLSPVQVGASVQLRDSLLGGQSRFYAEIQRLRLVFELAEREGPPVLFLLDEILHGTNAQERRQGAEAVVRALLERRAGGVVTTHDLALAEIVPRSSFGAANAHFADRVEEGELRFDYRLRPGVASQGNALGLMRAVGLPV
jgi:hypothetical protein